MDWPDNEWAIWGFWGSMKDRRDKESVVWTGEMNEEWTLGYDRLKYNERKMKSYWPKRCK